MITFLLILSVALFFIGLRLGAKDDCPKAWSHNWQERDDWNNSLELVSVYTGDLIARRGKRCYHCGEMRWYETDGEFRERSKDVAVTRKLYHIPTADKDRSFSEHMDRAYGGTS